MWGRLAQSFKNFFVVNKDNSDFVVDKEDNNVKTEGMRVDNVGIFCDVGMKEDIVDSEDIDINKEVMIVDNVRSFFDNSEDNEEIIVTKENIPIDREETALDKGDIPEDRIVEKDGNTVYKEDILMYNVGSYLDFGVNNDDIIVYKKNMVVDKDELALDNDEMAIEKDIFEEDMEVMTADKVGSYFDSSVDKEHIFLDIASSFVENSKGVRIGIYMITQQLKKSSVI